MKYVIILGIMAILLLPSEGRTFSRCELVRELRRHGFPESQLRDWVCLVEHESGRSTEAIGRMNKDGSLDFGLFQINDRYWCSNTNTPGKECHVTCKELLLDDITKAANCAKKIYQRHKFEAWYGWVDHCKGRELPDISSCGPSRCSLCQASQ